MSLLSLAERDLASPRFKTLVRSLGNRQDTALGVLLLFWHNSRTASISEASASQLLAFVVTPPEERRDTLQALIAAGYLEALTQGPLDKVLFRVVGNARAIALRAKRKQVSLARVRRPERNKSAARAVAKEIVAVPRSRPVRARAVPVVSEHLEATRAAWAAYAEKYLQVTGTEPLRNAKQNALIKQFCQRVPKTIAADIIRFYVGHKNQTYRERTWSLDMLVKDAESLFTQYQARIQVTRAEIRDLSEREQRATRVARFSPF